LYELSFIDRELLNFGLISFNSIANLYFVTFGDAQFAKFNQKLVEEKEMNELLWQSSPRCSKLSICTFNDKS